MFDKENNYTPNQEPDEFEKENKMHTQNESPDENQPYSENTGQQQNSGCQQAQPNQANFDSQNPYYGQSIPTQHDPGSDDVSGQSYPGYNQSSFQQDSVTGGGNDSGYQPYQSSQSGSPAEDNNCTYHYTKPDLYSPAQDSWSADSSSSDPNTSFNQGYQNEPYSGYSASAGTEDRSHQYSSAAVTPPPKKDGEKKKKKDRRFGVASLVSVSLASALICGIISSATTLLVNDSLNNSTAAASSSSSLNTNNTKTTYVNESTDASVTTAAEKASPSVVGIRVSTTASNSLSQYSNSDSSTATSEGSGVVYTTDGYIITNYHVVSDAIDSSSSSSTTNPYNQFGSQQQAASSTIVEVYLPDDPDTGIEAEIVGYDISADLAVLKIDRTDLTAIEIGDSDSLVVGESAVAIGNPGGLDFMGSVSSGVVSGLNRQIETENNVVMTLIQTDAAINPGNSGGALVNIYGQLIGINNSKMAGEDYEGMGFAIPVNEVVEICNRLIANEGEPIPYIGIMANTSYDSSTLEQLGYPAGVVVYSVSEDSPAADAGIQRNDIITHFNGAEVSSYALLTSEKNKCSVGDTVTVTVYRGGQTLELSLTLEASSS